MIDDVRLAVLGAAPVTFIGGLSLDSSGFGIAPDLDVALLKDRILRVLNASREGAPA
jgi:2-oxoglutarate ferredoxin oxidoreductase subunit alpha